MDQEDIIKGLDGARRAGWAKYYDSEQKLQIEKANLSVLWKLLVTIVPYIDIEAATKLSRDQLDLIFEARHWQEDKISLNVADNPQLTELFKLARAFFLAKNS